MNAQEAKEISIKAREDNLIKAFAVIDEYIKTTASKGYTGLNVKNKPIEMPDIRKAVFGYLTSVEKRYTELGYKVEVSESRLLVTIRWT